MRHGVRRGRCLQWEQRPRATTAQGEQRPTGVPLTGLSPPILRQVPECGGLQQKISAPWDAGCPGIFRACKRSKSINGLGRGLTFECLVIDFYREIVLNGQNISYCTTYDSESRYSTYLLLWPHNLQINMMIIILSLIMQTVTACPLEWVQ